MASQTTELARGNTSSAGLGLHVGLAWPGGIVSSEIL